MGDFGAHNTRISIQSLPLRLTSFPPNLPRTPSPLARTDSAGWYICENEDFPIELPGSPKIVLPPSASQCRTSSDVEILSQTPSLKLGIPEPSNSTTLEPTPSQPNGSARQPQTTKFKRAIDKVIEEQSDVSAKRAWLQQLRQRLKRKRDEEGAFRASIIRKLNALSTRIETRPLGSEFEQLQSVTDAYLDLERNYTQVEDELIVEEVALFETMKKLSDMLQQTPVPAAMEDTVLSDSESDDTSSTISGSQQVPPSVSAYLSRVGDMRLLRERLAELELEWLTIVDKQSVRQKFGIPMDEESLEFLRDYDEERGQIQEELSEAFHDVKRLRAICDNEGVVMDQYAKGIESVYEDYRDETTQQPTDPLKTSPTDDNHPFFEVGPGQLNRTTFINKWLLHRLRHSTVEISRLKSLPELQSLADKGWDQANISRLALTMWFTDDSTVLSPPSTPSVDCLSENEAELGKDAPQELENRSKMERARSTIGKCNSDRHSRSNPPHRVRSLSV